jgi:hypothetical protein
MSPIQTQIIEKVRLSGCLSEDELQAYEYFSDLWETRLKVDLLDYQWTQEVPNHIIQVKTNGIRTYHLPNSSNSKVTAFLGVFCILFGLIGMPVMGMNEMTPLGWFMAVIGAFVFFRSKRDKQGWVAYDEARETYYDSRHAALKVLPEEFHPANRVCLNCVKPIT